MMTKSKRRKIQWYISLPHIDSDLAKKIIRELLEEIDKLKNKKE
jgi:hypothetical protein